MKKIIIILIIGLIVFISGCLNENTPTKEKSSENNQSTILNTSDDSYIEPLEGEIKMTETINTLKGLKPTAEPYQFKVGETYIYHIHPTFVGWTESQCEPVEIDIPVHVDRSERINKSEYWILKAEQVNVTPQCYVPLPNGQFRKGYLIENGDGTPIPVSFGGSIIAVYKNNLSYGFSLNANNLNSMCVETFVEIPPELALYLNEDVKIVQESKGAIGKDKKECGNRMEISVLDSEKINNKDCFKVEVLESTNCGFVEVNDKISQRTYLRKNIYWIDKQTRMVMKYQGYIGTDKGFLLDVEIELKEIKKMY